MAVISPPILKILSDLDIDLMDIDSDVDYLRAVIEATNMLSITNPSDKRIPILQKEVKRVRDNRKAKSKITKKTISTSKLLNRKSKGDVGEKGMESNTGKLARILRDTRGKVLANEKKIDLLGKPTESEENGADLLVIKEKVVSIESLLGEQYRLQEENAKDAKQEAEKKRRSLKERLLEGSGKVWDGVKKATSTVLKPFQGIWENIIGFIKKIILGRVLFKILEWTSNPENQGKIDSIFKFLKDWWPVLLTAYLAFGNGLSRFVLGLVGKLTIWSAKLLAKVIPALLKAIAAMGPWGWAALGTAAVVGGGMYLHNKNKNKEGGEETGIPDVIPRDEDFVHYGPDEGVGKGFSQKEENQKMNKMMEEKNFNKGGQVPGSGNRDTVPAMLTPGEFVMSKGAVQQYGVDTLAGMNAAAGGTNIPTIMSGNTGYSGGGLVQPVVEAGSINSYEDAIKAGVKVEDVVVGNMRYGSMKWTEKLPKGLFRKQKYQIRGTEWMLDGIGKDHNKMLDIPTEDFVNKRMGWDKASSSSTKENKIKAVPSKSGDPKVDQGSQGGGVGFFKGMGNIMGGKKWSGESRAQIGRSVSKSSNITPPTNTAKVTVINQPGTEQVDASQAQLPPAGNREIPSFDATAIRSSHKMEVLGISV